MDEAGGVACCWAVAMVVRVCGFAAAIRVMVGAGGWGEGQALVLWEGLRCAGGSMLGRGDPGHL